MTISRSKAWTVLAVGAFVAPTLLRAQDSTSQQQHQLPPADSAAEARTHSVRAGDTLWDLARAYLGDPFLWPEIYRLNTAVVEDPHWIYPGERLQLPDGSGATPADETLADNSTMVKYSAPTTFLRGRTRSGAQSTGRLSLVGRTPRPVIRAGEYYAAPWVERSGGPRGAGKIVASADLPGIAAVSERDRLHVQDRVLVTLPAGAAPDSGARYLVFGLGPHLAGSGQVVVPTGLVVLEGGRHRPGEAIHARVLAMYDEMRVGQGVMRFDTQSFPTDPRPAPVELGRIDAKVVWVKGEHVLNSVHQYLVLNRTQRDGVKPGDQFTLLRDRVRIDRGVTLPEEEIAIAQVVRVTPFGSTAIIIDQAQPAIRTGNSARLSARVP